MLLRRMESRESDQAQCQLIAKRKGKKGKQGKRKRKKEKGKKKKKKRPRRLTATNNMEILIEKTRQLQ